MSEDRAETDFEKRVKAFLRADLGPYLFWLAAFSRVAGEVIDGWNRGSYPPGKGYWRQLVGYWEQAGRDLRHNLSVAWPVFTVLMLFLGLSATGLYWAENGKPGIDGTTVAIQSWWDALYFTWVTMATVDNVRAADWTGRLLTSLDVLMGLLTIGVIVWLITKSLTQTRTEERLVKVVEGLQPRLLQLIEGFQASLRNPVPSPEQVAPDRPTQASGPESAPPSASKPVSDSEPASEIVMMEVPGSPGTPQMSRRVGPAKRAKPAKPVDEDDSGH